VASSHDVVDDEELRYLRCGELRKRIARAVGGDPDRYGGSSTLGLTRSERQALAVRVTDLKRSTVAEANIYELTRLLTESLDGDTLDVHSYCLRREHLKELVRRLDGGETDG
jgi:hypothetical protein